MYQLFWYSSAAIQSWPAYFLTEDTLQEQDDKALLQADHSSGNVELTDRGRRVEQSLEALMAAEEQTQNTEWHKIWKWMNECV